MPMPCSIWPTSWPRPSALPKRRSRPPRPLSSISARAISQEPANHSVTWPGIHKLARGFTDAVQRGLQDHTRPECQNHPLCHRPRLGGRPTDRDIRPSDPGKWWDRTKDESLDTVMEGRFTRLFPYLPTATFDRGDLERLADQMVARAEPESTPETHSDPEENPGIPAAYTYLGQFVDHDLTF